MSRDGNTILLVDDDPTVREVLAENLGRQGFNVLQGGDGEQGVILALQEQPDLVISDIVMPRMDGWDFCYTLRHLPSTKAIPFIFLSSLDKTPDRVMGLKLGADDYLTKPFSPAEVVFKVRGILRRMAVRREVVESREFRADNGSMKFLLVDVIEYLRGTHRTGVLAVYGQGANRGIIQLRDGQPVHAAFGDSRGEGAIFAMIRLDSSNIKYVEQDHPDLEPNLTLSWAALVERVLDGPREDRADDDALTPPGRTSPP
jgi:CheY-like chemotaxis protein